MSIPPVIRDIFVQSLVPSLHTKLLVINASIPIDWNAMYRGEDGIMPWEELIIRSLPDIIKELTPKEITERFIKELQRRYRPYTLSEILRGETTCVPWILYVCTERMCTDVVFQSRIAEILYHERDTEASKQEVDDFARRYQKANGRPPKAAGFSRLNIERAILASTQGENGRPDK